MDFEVSVDAAKAICTVGGKVTAQSAPQLESAFGRLDSAVRDIDVDLSRVTFLSSAGLRVLVGAQKLASRRGGAFRILHPQDAICEVFDVTGLADVFKIVR